MAFDNTTEEVDMSKLHSQERGFTLVELLVVVAIIVALATASFVSVTQFTGKGQEGATASEKASVQAAMDTLMADLAITAVTANNLATVGTSIKDFTTAPAEGDLYPEYLRTNPTYYYCWDATGRITEQTTAATACTL